MSVVNTAVLRPTPWKGASPWQHDHPLPSCVKPVRKQQHQHVVCFGFKYVYLVEGAFDGFFLDNSIVMLGKKMSKLLFETLYTNANGNIIICILIHILKLFLYFRIYIL